MAAAMAGTHVPAGPASASTLHVVDGLRGSALCEVAVEPGWDMRELRRAVGRQLSIPKSEVYLMWAGRGLTASDAPADLLVGDSRTVRFARIRPGWRGALELPDPGGVLPGLDELITGKPHPVKQAARELLADRGFALVALQESGIKLRLTTEALRGDRELVLVAVSECGIALSYAAEALRDDREVVLAAVRRDGVALEFASEALRGDRDVVGAAVREDGMAIRHASDELRRDRDLGLAAVRQCGAALPYVHPALREDRSFVQAAMRLNGDAFNSASGDERDRDSAAAASAFWAGGGDAPVSLAKQAEPFVRLAEERCAQQRRIATGFAT